MARTDRFYIGQLAGKGLQTNVKPYAIADNAFQILQNAYVFRGRVRKRFGGQLLKPSTPPTQGYETLPSRLRINIGTTDGAGAFAGTVPVSGGVPIVTPAIGQAFSIGDEIFTVTAIPGPNATIITTGAATLTYVLATGAITVAGAALTTDIYFYPALPVMGLLSQETVNVNDEPSIGFDTVFSYQFTNDGWECIDDATVWTGTNSDYFWGCNWHGSISSDYLLFVTNYISADEIKYLDSVYAWDQIAPIVNNTNRLQTARIILPFKDRLIALNTKEYVQGTQFSSPNLTNASTGDFNQTVAGAYVLGQQFIVGNTIFEIASNAAGLQNMTVYGYPGSPTVATAQFNFATGNLVITGNGTNLGLPVYFFDGVTTNEAVYTNRCRFSLNGNPLLTNGWIDQVSGLGGYIDAPTREAIVTAQFLKDRLIVYFERSTWELVYTGNQILPFIWQKINTELGAESSFSQIPFDEVVLGVGNVGIHACNGSNVSRVDDNIPDIVFQIHNYPDGIKRVYGIRDFFVEMSYWSFPDIDASSTFPFCNKVLTYNYKNGCWGVNDDSITVFGYYSTNANQQETWQQDNTTWESDNSTWGVGVNTQQRFRSIIAGNQEGYTFIVNPDSSKNVAALQITNITDNGNGSLNLNIINHNLRSSASPTVGDFIYIESAQFSDVVDDINDTIHPLTVVDANNITIIGSLDGETYLGGGVVTRVSNINIVTKQFNVYADKGYNASFNKIDFFVDKTTSGEILVNYQVGSSSVELIGDGTPENTIPGSTLLEDSVSSLQTSPYDLYPLEATQARLWHPVYVWANGESIQLNLYMGERQLLDPDIAFQDFQLHAICIYATPTSSRLE